MRYSLLYILLLCGSLLLAACNNEGRYVLTNTHLEKVDATRLVEKKGYTPIFCQGTLIKLLNPQPMVISPEDLEILTDALRKYPMDKSVEELTNITQTLGTHQIFYQYTYFPDKRPVDVFTLTLSNGDMLWYRKEGGRIIFPFEKEGWVTSSCDDVNLPSGQKRSELPPSDFPEFFTRFAKDTAFQLSHIAYPLPYLLYNPKDTLPITQSIARGQWTYIPFALDSTARYNATGAFAPHISIRNDTVANYMRQGINNGVSIDYHFRKRVPGGWQLVRIEDASY